MSTCLLTRARAGDRLATRRVVDSLRPRIERMALYYARRCGEDPDDLLQEAWIGLLEAVPLVDVRIGVPEQYLVRRARWRLLDAVKRARLRRCASLDPELLEERPESAASGPTAEVVAAGVDVSAFMHRLSPTQQQVARCLMAGLTWREAGSALGCTSANVAYHVRQIRKQWESWHAASPN